MPKRERERERERRGGGCYIIILFKGTRPLSNALFVLCKLYRYICLILLKKQLDEFVWMRID